MARFGGKFGSPSLAGSASMVLTAIVRGVQLERFARGDETGDPRSWLAAGKAPAALVPRLIPMQRQGSADALNTRAVLLSCTRAQLQAGDAPVPRSRSLRHFPARSTHSYGPTSLLGAGLVQAPT
jgi:hypothetical protein